MKVTKEQIIGFASSAILCLIIVFILAFIFLQTEVKAEEEGTLVNFGTVDWAAGTFEPKAEGTNREIPAVEEIIPAVESVKPAKTPPVITQNTEQTAAVETPAKKPTEQERRLAEEQRQKAEEQRRREAINRQMSGAFGVGDTPGGNEGTAASGTGNQGSTQGNAAVGSYTGVGGIGFNLNGRTLRDGNLQRPAYAAQEEGTIVVEITVDPNGNVTQAKIQLRGTNIENPSMRKSAIEAAQKTKFNAITTTNNQIGTITYKYTLK
ncbi:MAG: TonB family protein [Candidatus Symbiothrix sp.]|jgi:TonB family protein|nr:TonB family protein [Candidatus Symbiothrix sp.]